MVANRCLIHFRVTFVSLTNVAKNNDNAVYFRCYRLLNIDTVDAFMPIKAFHFLLLPHLKPLAIKRL